MCVGKLCGMLNCVLSFVKIKGFVENGVNELIVLYVVEFISVIV